MIRFKSQDKKENWNIGLLEMSIALYPILAGYGYGSFKLSFGFLFIIDMFLIWKKSNISISFKKIYQYLIFIILHGFLWLFVMPSIPSYFINSFIADIIYLISIVLIVPHIDFNKLKNSIYIVAFICLIGLLYHVLILRMGHSVQPIKLPFMPGMETQSRLYSFLDRPTSFFWEPQSYSSYMLVPLFFTLREKKMLASFIIAASMISSTSTTGILMALLMIGFFMFTQRQKTIYKILGFLAIIGLCYFLLYSSLASSGLEKLQNTDLEESNRTINGLLIAQNLNYIDLILGVPFANLQDAYEASYITKDLIVLADGEVFVSAFWISLCCQGLIGLYFFLSIYWDIFRKCKLVFPYLACIVISLFSNPDILGASYVFQIIIMYSFINYSKNITINGSHYESKYSYIPVR